MTRKVWIAVGVVVAVAAGGLLWLRAENKRRSDCRITTSQADTALALGDVEQAQSLRGQLWETCRDAAVMADFDSRLSKARKGGQ